ncbi:MAG: hypothetical protein PHU23_16855, partial [Dehalococcoidales bacterium]|nr:hypothetical protein [Dehalococcoidales bacterium]
RLLAEANKEATQISGQYMAEAEKKAQEINRSATEIKEKAVLEAEQIKEAARKVAAANAEKEAADIIAQAKTRAQKESEDLVSAAVANAKRAAETETNQILQKARKDAEDIVNAAKNKVSAQLAESNRFMMEIQRRMQQVIGNDEFNLKATEDNAPVNGSHSTSNQSPTQVPANTPPAVSQEKVQEKAQPSEPTPAQPVYNNKHGETAENSSTQSKSNSMRFDEQGQIYSGKLRIDITPPVDNEQIGILERHLSKTDGLRITARGGSEDGSAWIEVDAASPMPLVSILQKIPSVKDVVGAKAYIIVALKSKQAS